MPTKKRSKNSSVKQKAKDLNSNFSPLDRSTSNTKIRIIGIGGGGCSIVKEISINIKRVSFVAANTDKRALKEIRGKVRPFQFGEKVTGGFGTGMNSELGREAANIEKEKIKKLMEGQDMCIFVSCLGGGTGAGAVPVFAKIAKEMGVIAYGIFTLPFKFEGVKKNEIALEALAEAKNNLNAISVLPNENIFKVIDKKTPLKEALSIINRNLSKSLEGLIETIYGSGLINIDFADLKTILDGRGRLAYLNTAEFDATKEIDDAIKKVTHSLFYSYGIEGANSVLSNITGSGNLGLKDVSFISEGITNLAGKNSKIIFGISQDAKIGNKIRITLLAVGCQSEELFPKEKKTIKEKETIKSPVKKTERVVKKRVKPIKKEKQQEKVDIKIRRNALEVKKAIEEVEKEIIENEDKWETPAFLRRSINNN